MSALIENLSLSSVTSVDTMPPFLLEAESVLRNIEPCNLVAPLREVSTKLSPVTPLAEETAGELQGALRLQNQWQAWWAERELLRADVQRGRQYLEETRRELSLLRAQLADWPRYESVCGHNPLPDLVQAIIVKEWIEKFLPGWLERREKQIVAVACQMEVFAQQNGLEHLI